MPAPTDPVAFRGRHDAVRSEAAASRRYGTTTDYVTSTQIYDSLGQARQTQTAAEGWNTTVSMTSYDSHGLDGESDDMSVAAGSPSTTPADVAASAFNDRAEYFYEGDGHDCSSAGHPRTWCS